jgi:hypothetical protein
LPEKIRKIFSATPRMEGDNQQEHVTRVMALFAQHCANIASAKFKYQNKMSEETKQREWDMAVAKAMHEENVIKFFTEDKNTTTEEEKLALEKVAEFAKKSTAEKWA